MSPLKPSDLGLCGKGSSFKENLEVLSTPLQKNQIIVAKDSKTLEIKKLNPLTKVFYSLKKNSNEKEVKKIVTKFVKKIDYKDDDAIQKTIPEFDQEIKELQKKIKKAKKKHSTLNKEIREGTNSGKTKIKRVDKKVKIEKEIKALKKELSSLKKEKNEAVKAKQQLDNLKDLLYKRMSKLSTSVYDRSKLRESVIEKIRPELAANKARKAELQKELDNISASKKKKRAKKEGEIALKRADRKIAKVKFAQKLGVPMKPIGTGMSGSYFATDYKGKKKGVFKPAVEESLTGNSPKLKDKVKKTIMKILPIANPAAVFHANEGYLAEAMTTTLATHMRFHTLPASKVVELSAGKLKNAKGSFQVFAKKTESAKEALVGLDDDEIKNLLSEDELEELFVIDFLTYNRDRHFENWLVSTEVNEETGKRNIYLIDHGLSFPKANPSRRDVFYRRNQFKWASLPQTESQFSDKMKNRIEGRLNDEKLDKLLDKLGNTDPDVTHFSEEDSKGNSQAAAFKQRVEVLKYCIDQNWTIREIATIKTQEDIDRVLEEKKLSEEG